MYEQKVKKKSYTVQTLRNMV